MAVMQGTFVQKFINIQNVDGSPVDISTWLLRGQLRRNPTDAAALAELTNANGGFVIVDGVNGRLAFTLDELVTAQLPVGRIHYDVLRDNAPSGPVWVFGGSFSVRQPITRSA